MKVIFVFYMKTYLQAGGRVPQPNNMIQIRKKVSSKDEWLVVDARMIICSISN